MLQAFPEDSAEYTAAKAFNQRFFPDGAVAVTSLPYEDEAATVGVMLQDLADDAQAWMATLNLGTLVNRLAVLHPQFEAELEKGPGDLDFATVRTSRKALQRTVRTVVAMLLTTYRDDDARLAEVLAPIVEQARRIRALHRTRRRVDVNPVDGVEIVDSEALPE